MKRTVLEKKLKELTGDQEKVLLDQMTELVECRSKVVEMRAAEIQTEPVVVPLVLVTCRKAAQSDTYLRSNISNRWSI